MAESYSVKAPNFLSKLYIFIHYIFNFYDIFFSKKDRTIEYFKIVIKYFYVKLILLQLDNENQSNSMSQRSRVRSPPLPTFIFYFHLVVF